MSYYPNHSTEWGMLDADFSPSSYVAEDGVSIVAWIKKTGTQWATGANYAAIFCDDVTVDNNAVRLYCGVDGVYCLAQNASGGSAGGGEFTADDYDDKWVPIVATINSATVRNAYIESTPTLGTGGNDKTLLANLSELRVGRFTSTGFGLFDGLIAHVAVFDKALSDTEIQALTNGTDATGFTGPPPNTVAPSNCIGYWPLTTDQTSHPDQSGNGGPALVEDATNTPRFESDNPTIPRPSLSDKPPVIFNRTARKPVMAYRWDEATASQVTYDFAPVGEVPATMAIWFYDTLSSLNDRNMIQIQDKDPDNQYFRMHVGETGSGTPTTHKIAIYAKNVTAGEFYASTAIERTQDHWHHACGVFAASNSRTIYIDAGNEGTNTLDAGEMATAILDSITIGREGDSTPDDSWNGSLIWPAVWNVVLTPSEIKLLASGVSPHLVRPESLKFFAPLDGRPNDMRCLVTGEVPSSITGLTTDSRFNGPPQLQGSQIIPLAVSRPNRRVVMF